MATTPKKVTAPKAAAATAQKANTDRSYVKAMVMANLVGRGGTLNQIEETADYIVERCYGSTKG